VWQGLLIPRDRCEITETRVHIHHIQPGICREACALPGRCGPLLPEIAEGAWVGNSGTASSRPLHGFEPGTGRIPRETPSRQQTKLIDPPTGSCPTASPERKPIQEGAQLQLTRLAPELAQGLCLYLPDPFARQGKTLTDLFECTGISVPKSEAHPDDLLFAP